MSLRWHYSTDRGGFPKTLLEKLGLEALLQKWPSRVVAPSEVISNLCAAAATELGLSQKVKVVQGADALIGMIGLGVAKPGQLALITGSSHLQFGVSDKPLHAPGIWGSYPDMVYPKRYIIEGAKPRRVRSSPGLVG